MREVFQGSVHARYFKYLRMLRYLKLALCRYFKFRLDFYMKQLDKCTKFYSGKNNDTSLGMITNENVSNYQNRIRV